jgi:large subunit ribosomal protein L4e
VPFPLVVTTDLEDLAKTQPMVDVFDAVGIIGDVERAEETTVRAGRGTTRGRRHRRPTSALVVTSETPSKAARNLPGVDVATGREVNAEDLAPGTHAGRLTLWTEAALEEVAER